MRLEFPWALLLLLLLPLVWERRERSSLLPLRGGRRRNSEGVVFAAPAPFAILRALGSSWRARWGSCLLSALSSFTYVMIVIALSRPQLGTAFRETESSGRDILLTLDLSRSMSALDFFLEGERIDRLAALKKVVKEFIDQRTGDRMGLVAFGQEVFTQCPLTTDRFALKKFVDELQVGMAGDATALGDALGLSLKRLMNIEANSKVIVLVTDGKSNVGTLQPIQAAQLAAQLKVKVYAVGIGGPEPAPIPLKDIFGIVRLQQREMEYDERTLREIARITGGLYFNAKDVAGLEKIYREIDRLEERREKTYEYVSYEERYLPFVLLAISVLILARLISATYLLRVA